MKIRWILVSVALAASAAACSSGSSSSTASAAGQAFASLNTSLSALATPPGGAATFAFGSKQMVKTDKFFNNVSDWSVALLPDPRNSGGSCTHTSAVTPQNYMQIDFTENATRCNGSDVNVFGRIHSALSTACIVAHALSAPTSADLPTSGTTTITFDGATLAMIATDCHTSITNAPDSVLLDFSVPSDTTNFDRIITATMTVDGVTQSAGAFYVSYGPTKVAVARNESNTNGANRCVAILDRTNNILKGEYLSGPNNGSISGFNGVYLHRIYYDGANDVGRVYSSIEYSSTLNAGGAVDSVNSHYVVTGKPKDTSLDLSVGMDFYSSGWGTYSNAGSGYNLQACVTPTTGVISSSGSTTCGAITGVSAASAVADAAAWTYVHSNMTTWFNFTAIPTISWDYSTIHTAGETP